MPKNDKDQEAKFTNVYPVWDPELKKIHLIALDENGVVWYFRQDRNTWFYFASDRSPGADASGSWSVVA